jgi:hypothetical protein
VNNRSLEGEQGLHIPTGGSPDQALRELLDVQAPYANPPGAVAIDALSSDERSDGRAVLLERSIHG